MTILYTAAAVAFTVFCWATVPKLMFALLFIALVIVLIRFVRRNDQ